MGNLKRVPALDGLRGLAIALVLMRHLFDFLQGWIGVDIFFALSGFLVTSILLQERDQPHFWRVFYIRRAARLLPALLLLLVLSGLLTGWRPSLLPFLLLPVTNIALFFRMPDLVASGTGVLWSLSVEEHYYLLWPAMMRRCSQHALVALLVAVIVVEPVARTAAHFAGATWQVTYFLTPFRLDGLALGSLMAILMARDEVRESARRLAPTVLTVGAAGLALAWPWLDEQRHPLLCGAFGFTWIALTAVAAIAFMVLRPYSVVAKVFAWKPLRFLGRISYGLYLLHQLLTASLLRYAARSGYPHPTRVFALGLVVSVTVAFVWFRLVEAPILALGRRWVGASLRARPAMAGELAQ